ncbi:Hsp20/alpha crystallin family protein [Saccharopolyspora sp. K220]|uniref:Hsp20/alpha crystallin family protein n=1 Tax=Saccharopolyspora soli TaxID=2926618 RepID=UPI001F58CE64|nr:Hsp20/alpha crystallin family protein [Saccharopolyspora soli]MCI2418655.1 Hsp20/alpha crystallin family protein [Saccharopolyspora soli]
MTLVRRSTWDPFNSLVRQLDRDLDLFGRRFFAAPNGGAFVPAADIERDGSDVVIKLDLPGVDIAKDVNVEVADGRLAISGQRSSDETREADNVVVREVRKGSFRREFDLPEGVGAEQVTADYDRGVLRVRVREVNKPSSGPAKIEIRDTAQEQ